MPVFLFALSQNPTADLQKTILSFLILHLLIYPSSNGYNSYQDKDEGSIGGLKYPPKVSENLFYATLLLDFTGVACAFFVSESFSVCVLIYILISRAYSYRKLRLKKNAVTGFLTVFFFQGAFTYMMAYQGMDNYAIGCFLTADHMICMAVASLFIGSVYPLTQIYQHASDKNDGVTTISYKLGYTGTFIFSSLMFSIAAGLLYYYFDQKNQLISLALFFVLMLPVVIRLGAWFLKVRKDNQNANFENTMSMNLMASTCMNIYFSILVADNHFHFLSHIVT
ncbi:MAG: UbiA family prenyltransferase [Bacteroidia bacterium]